MGSDPYRTNDAAPRRTLAAGSTGPTRATALPLGVIAITFFMPMVRVCDEHAVSPMREATRSPGGFFVITPVFFSAAVLCVAILYTFATQRSATRAPLLAMAWNVLASGVCAIGSIGDRTSSWVPFGGAALSAPVFGFAWSSRGLRRLALLVDAYLLSAFPIALIVAVSAEHYGAYVFVGAYAGLVLLRAIQIQSSWIAKIKRVKWPVKRTISR